MNGRAPIRSEHHVLIPCPARHPVTGERCRWGREHTGQHTSATSSIWRACGCTVGLPRHACDRHRQAGGAR